MSQQAVLSIEAELRDLDRLIARTEEWAATCPESFAAQLQVESLQSRRVYLLRERAAAEAATRERTAA